MKDNGVTIEQRLQNIKNFYFTVGGIIESLPDAIPSEVKSLLQDKILGDKELKNLMDGLDAHRPPRIFLIGRTGVGKSSLINALCGAYVARVSDIKSETTGASTYQCKDNERVLMEILDTRGIAESESLDRRISAEDLLLQEISEFSPDVAIFMLNATHRNDIGSDTEFLKKVAHRYFDENKLELPILVVVNKCDQLPPVREHTPQEYSKMKIKKIDEAVKDYKRIVGSYGLRVQSVTPISSLLEWRTPDGEVVSDKVQ